MISYDNVRSITRIYDTPTHVRYEPTRRLWMILEQLFGDQGGIERFEARLRTYQDASGIPRLNWDDHFQQLLSCGLSECDAQRTVVQQMLFAREWLS